MPRSRSNTKRRPGQTPGALGGLWRNLGGLVEFVRTERIGQYALAGVIVFGIGAFLVFRGCSDEANYGFRRSQEAAKAMAAAGLDPPEVQPGEKLPPKKGTNGAKGKEAGKPPSSEQYASDDPALLPAVARPGSRSGRGSAGPSGKLLPAVVLPEKPVDWTEKDFLLAKSAEDRRLLPAIQERIQCATGTESEAKLYIALLQPSAKDQVQPGGGGDDPTARRNPRSGLTATLVAALAANGTPAARDALRQLLAGGLKTDDDRAATDAVLKSLVERSGREDEGLFYQALVTPGELRPPGRGSVSADTIQARACELTRQSGTARLRARVAEAAMDVATPETLRNRLRAIVEPSDPRNTEAQIILYQGGFPEGPARVATERRLSALGSDALAGLFGFPNKTPIVADANLAQQACARLWGQQFTGWLAQQPQRIESLEEGATLLMLAATIPSERVRAKLTRTLNRYVDAGPSALAKTGVVTNAVTEPGFFVAIKSVERQLRLSNRGEGVRSGAAIRSEEARRQLLQRQEQKEKITREWNEFSEAVLRAWCRRLYAAAANGGTRPVSRGDVSPSPIKLAFRSHAGGEDAEMVAVYRFDLPGATGDGLADRLDLLQIRYARIEERTRLAKLVEFYRRQLDCEVWSVDDGVWLDCLLADPRSGRRRSLDVLITSRVKTRSSVARPNDDDAASRHKGNSSFKGKPSAARPKWKPGLLADDDEELIVDILSIEVNLPED